MPGKLRKPIQVMRVPRGSPRDSESGWFSSGDPVTSKKMTEQNTTRDTSNPILIKVIYDDFPY
jgi:hypothetical protein